MKLIINGQEIEVESITEEVDSFFLEFYSAFFSNKPLNWDKLQIGFKEFINKNHDNIQLTAPYFRNFTIVWRHFLSQGLWDKAEKIWELALDPVVAWEIENEGSRVHKGAAYYFWGMTAILRGDLDRGYALMHQALTEDTLTHNKEFPKTPSFAFAALDYEDERQAFREWVLNQARYLSQYANKFSEEFQNEFSLKRFRDSFLAAPPNIDTIYLFGYIVARLMQIEKLPGYLLSSVFAGQLIQNILFDLVQVIDEALKAKIENNWRMIDFIENLSNSLGDPISNAQLRKLNEDQQNDFNNTVRSILDGNYQFEDGEQPTSLQISLLLLYILRNHGAHDISSSSIFWERYSEIKQQLIYALFFTVEAYY